MELIEALGKAGVLVLVGVLITAFYGRANNKDTYKLALRKLENEEDAEAKKERAELRESVEKLHAQQIAFMDSQIENYKELIEQLKTELEAERKKSAVMPPPFTTEPTPFLEVSTSHIEL